MIQSWLIEPYRDLGAGTEYDTFLLIIGEDTELLTTWELMAVMSLGWVETHKLWSSERNGNR